MRRQYLYVYRTRKPSGWGVHNGYTGRTNSPWHRDRQHQSKPWADLIVRRHVIPLGRVPVFVAIVAEYVLIKLTMPVYNVQHNRTNPRRIRKRTAQAQRRARDAGRTPVGARALDMLRLLPVFAVVALAAWLWI